MMKIKRILMVMALWIWLGCLTVLGEDYRVYDDAYLYTDSEIDTLEKECKDLGEKHKLEIFIVTEEEMGQTSDSYLNRVYETHSKKNGVMLYVSMNPRKIYVYEYSWDNSHFRFSDDDLHEIEDATASASNPGENFMAAARTFMSRLSSDMPGGFVNGKDHFIKTKTLVISFIVCLVIGGIVVLIMYSGQKSKKVTDGSVYMKPGSSVDVLEQGDIYTHTTKEVIHHESSSSGGGGGGGGGGHSGGGSSF